jgi:hypothetical protein
MNRVVSTIIDANCIKQAATKSATTAPARPMCRVLIIDVANPQVRLLPGLTHNLTVAR